MTQQSPHLRKEQARSQALRANLLRRKAAQEDVIAAELPQLQELPS